MDRISEVVETKPDVEAAPGRDTSTIYRARRVLRTTRVQLMSRAMGDHVYHPDGPHAALRNAIMSAKSQAEWYGVLDWLYGGSGLD